MNAVAVTGANVQIYQVVAFWERRVKLVQAAAVDEA
jgi:hypothetical protein